MDKITAQNLITETFNQAFDEQRYELFISNLLNDIEPRHNVYSGNLIWDDFKDHISSYKRIGKYTDPVGDALDVLIVQVKTIEKLDRARTALRNFVIKHLSRFDKDFALVAFYSKEDNGADWRFSFVKLEYTTEMKKGKVKVKKEFTPAKRFSFLVGEYEKAYTAQTQLLPLLKNILNNPVICKTKDNDGSIEDAFSIEKVTDEFFEQYKELYIKLYEYFQNHTSLQAELTKSGTDTVRFTKKLLGQIVFLYFLQKKGWMGVPKNETWGKGNKRFIQSLFNKAEQKEENFFKDKLQFLFYEALALSREDKNSYYDRFDCRIPFLNGGLFEAEYDWKNANISIPKELFRNREKNKAGDIGTGILDVFDRYNFTIKEDEPLDKEVAVDPEMLGKVFENMLEITERKSKGAFYTPREIVHYMCQESLIHYLDNALNEKINREDIETFIREGHNFKDNDERVAAKGETKTYQYQLPESIRKNADLIDKKLSNIKICDPAIGSGAFPVGLLHELVNAMLVLKPHLTYDYLTEKLKGFGFEHRESINESRYIYRLKRHIIQESIYGVDIDPSAIDIARLRLWLSLVVDEDNLDPIETLPNLDYKIVCGNSLIGLPENAMRDLKVEAELEVLKDKFYNLTDEKEKKALRQEINSKIRELLDSAEQFAGYEIDFDYKLFFSEVWREKGGFDVVIGNPPYKIEYNLKVKAIYNHLYHTFKRNNDIYIAFFQNGLNHLNNHGSLNYITPNSFLNGDYFIEFRKHIAKLFSVVETIDFKSHNVFSDPTVYVSITHITKSSKIHQQRYSVYDGLLPVNDFVEIHKSDFEDSIIPKHPSYIKIINSIKLKFDDVFYIKDVGFNYWTKGGGKKRNNKSIGKRVFIKKKESKHDIPYIKGAQIKPFYIEEPQNFLRFNYKEYLDPLVDTFRFSKDILNVSPKICYRQTANKIISAIDYNSQLCDKTVHVIINKKKATYKLEIVTLLLNSELFLFLYREISQERKGRAFSQVKTTYLKKMPFKYIENKSFLKIYDYLCILYSHLEESIITVYFSTIVDALIYELYFPTEFQIAGKEVLKHLGDLKPISDEISKEEKLAIIQSEFERLYDANHPVRNAIETLDSVEEVRIIKEALK